MSTRAASSLGRRGPRCVGGLAAGAAVAVLLAACGGSGAPSSDSGPAVSSQLVKDCRSTSQCYGPPQFRLSYGIQELLDNGIDGRGQTVVLVEFAAQAGDLGQALDQ